MDKEKILETVKNHAVKNGLDVINLYNSAPNPIESVDVSSLKIEQLSSAIAGQNLLRNQELIAEVLPFMKFDNSKHYYQVIFRHAKYLYNNKNCLTNSLKQNKDLFNQFSVENKEMYFIVGNILSDRFVEVQDIFKPILERKGVILERKKSVSYNLDLNEFINLMHLKHFILISHELSNLLNQLKNNKEFNEYFGVEESFFNQKSKSDITVYFSINKNEGFIDIFMNSLITSFIDYENSLTKLNEKNDFSKLIQYNLMQENLKNDRKINKMKI